MTRRTDRVGNIIQRELSQYIRRDMSDPRLGFLTLSRVEMTSDFAQAKILVSVLGEEAEKQATLAVLAREAPRMRTHLSKILQTRTVPRLFFEIDRNLDHGFRIAELLKEVREQEEERGGPKEEKP